MVLEKEFTLVLVDGGGTSFLTAYTRRVDRYNPTVRLLHVDVILVVPQLHPVPYMTNEKTSMRVKASASDKGTTTPTQRPTNIIQSKI